MAVPLVLVALNKLIVTCLGSKLLDRKLTTTSNRSCTLANIHRSKVNVAKKDVNASYTYVTKVFSVKVVKISFTNTFLTGKQPLGITCKPFGKTKWIQTFSLSKKLLSHTTLHLPKYHLGSHGPFKIGL